MLGKSLNEVPYDGFDTVYTNLYTGFLYELLVVGVDHKYSTVLHLTYRLLLQPLMKWRTPPSSPRFSREFRSIMK